MLGLSSFRRKLFDFQAFHNQAHIINLSGIIIYFCGTYYLYANKTVFGAYLTCSLSNEYLEVGKFAYCTPFVVFFFSKILIFSLFFPKYKLYLTCSLSHEYLEVGKCAYCTPFVVFFFQKF